MLQYPTVIVITIHEPDGVYREWLRGKSSLNPVGIWFPIRISSRILFAIEVYIFQ